MYDVVPIIWIETHGTSPRIVMYVMGHEENIHSQIMDYGTRDEVLHCIAECCMIGGHRKDQFIIIRKVPEWVSEDMRKSLIEVMQTLTSEEIGSFLIAQRSIS